MRESTLWIKFSGCVPPGGMAVRIENSVTPDTPDVLMTWRGKTILIELKADGKPSKGQMDWARRWHEAGGESWFLIADKKTLHLVPGNEIKFYMNGYKYPVKNCREAIDKIYES